MTQKTCKFSNDSLDNFLLLLASSDNSKLLGRVISCALLRWRVIVPKSILRQLEKIQETREARGTKETRGTESSNSNNNSDHKELVNKLFNADFGASILNFALSGTDDEIVYIKDYWFRGQEVEIGTKINVVRISYHKIIQMLVDANIPVLSEDGFKLINYQHPHYFLELKDHQILRFDINGSYCYFKPDINVLVILDRLFCLIDVIDPVFLEFMFIREINVFFAERLLDSNRKKMYGTWMDYNGDITHFFNIKYYRRYGQSENEDRGHKEDETTASTTLENECLTGLELIKFVFDDRVIYYLIDDSLDNKLITFKDAYNEVIKTEYESVSSFINDSKIGDHCNEEIGKFLYSFFLRCRQEHLNQATVDRDG